MNTEQEKIYNRVCAAAIAELVKIGDENFGFYTSDFSKPETLCLMNFFEISRLYRARKIRIGTTNIFTYWRIRRHFPVFKKTIRYYNHKKLIEDSALIELLWTEIIQKIPEVLNYGKTASQVFAEIYHEYYEVKNR